MGTMTVRVGGWVGKGTGARGRAPLAERRPPGLEEEPARARKARLRILPDYARTGIFGRAWSSGFGPGSEPGQGQEPDDLLGFLDPV